MLVVVDGIHVRLKGVAAPEVAHYDKPGEPGGEAANAFVVDLIEGQVVARAISPRSARTAAASAGVTGRGVTGRASVTQT